MQNNVSFNKTKTLSSGDLFKIELNKQFFIIMTSVSGICVGFLLSQFIIELIKYIIPKNKYNKLILVITIFISLVIFLFISTILFTLNTININKTSAIGK